MSELKPITIHGHAGGPNPWKVAMFLEELKVPYTTTFHEFPDLKQEPFLKLNPNGRTPVIEDPNTGITLWESGAILEYLEDTYDKAKEFTYTSSPEKYYQNQWLHFQVSGQGPYFGQKVWFSKYHADKVPSAIQRYADEIKRVIGVLDRHLKQAGTPYLVGDKYTYADLAFVPWQVLVPFALEQDDYNERQLEGEFPSFHAWWQRVSTRTAIAKVIKDREAKLAGH